MNLLRDIENRLRECSVSEFVIKSRSPEISRFLQGDRIIICRRVQFQGVWDLQGIQFERVPKGHQIEQVLAARAQQTTEGEKC